jgi:ABC-2 type transport system permease protein
MSRQTDETTSNSTTKVEPSDITVQSSPTINKHTLHNIQLISEREYKNRTRQRSFIISTIVMAVLIAIGTFVPTIIAYFSSRSTTQTTIAIVNHAGTIATLDTAGITQYFATSLNGTSGTGTSGKDHFKLTVEPITNINTLQTQVKNGKITIILVIDRTANKDLRFTYYTASNNTTDQPQIQALANQLSVMDKAARLGLQPAQTQSLFAAPQFTVVNTQANQNNSDTSTRLSDYFMGMAGMILIFMSISIYGVGVASGVAEEKGSRIMEILINAATPFQLMVGKILGIGAAGLTQMIILVAVGLGGLAIQSPIQTALGITNIGFSFNINSTSVTVFVLLLVYFILGFLLYATLYAALGALVKRQDEVQNGTAPINMLFMVGYLSSFIGGGTALSGNTSATWFKVMSLIPFWTPTVMLMRVGVGDAAPWEIALSIVLLIATILICAWGSARIYRFGVLMYGQKPSLGQTVQILKAK